MAVLELVRIPLHLCSGTVSFTLALKLVVTNQATCGVSTSTVSAIASGIKFHARVSTTHQRSSTAAQQSVSVIAQTDTQYNTHSAQACSLLPFT